MIEISPDYQFEPEDVIVVIGKIEILTGWNRKCEE